MNLHLNQVIPFISAYSQWLIILWILLSSTLYIVSVICGLGITFDSRLYSSIAVGFSDMGFWESLDLTGLESWPPLFPLVISWIGLDQMVFLQGVSLILLLTVCCRISRDLVQRKVVLVMIMFGISLGTPLFLVHGFLWSESFFMLLFCCEVGLFLSLRKTGSALTGLGLIVVGNLMCLQRHSGIFLILGLFLVQLLQARNSRQVLWGISYFLLASLSFWWWNGWVSVGTHDRISALIVPLLTLDLSHYYLNLKSFGYAISYWIVPYRTIWVLILVLIIAVVALLGPLRWKAVVSRSQTQNYRVLVVAFMVYYFLLHIPFTKIPDSPERHLSPLYALFVWLVLVPMDWIPRQGLKSVGGKITLIFILIWLCYVSVRAVKNVVFWNSARCGHTIETSSIQVADIISVRSSPGCTDMSPGNMTASKCRS